MTSVPAAARVAAVVYGPMPLTNTLTAAATPVARELASNVDVAAVKVLTCASKPPATEVSMT